MPKTIDRERFHGFSREVRSYLPRIHGSLDTLRTDPARADAVEEAHGLIHRIRDNASALGLPALSHIGFLLEEAIEELATGQLQWSPAVGRTLSRVLGLSETYLDAPEGRRH